MEKKLCVYTDVGARGNPGPAGIGAVIQDEDGRVLSEISQYIGSGTNNQAEYRALLAALDKAVSLGGSDLTCFLDSELVVKQLRGEYKIREASLQELAAQVLRITKSFRSIDFRHIPREKNKPADKLVNEALDKAGF
ncbi:MAG: ribonuclease HI family protein [Candidatus Saccharibacteria bacterium]